MTEGSVENIKSLEVPKLFKSIFDGASANQIAVALFAEVIQGKPENVWIGLRALQQKGEEGLLALRQLSTGSDQLAVVARELVASPKMSGDRLEKLLGINRWGTTLEMHPDSRLDFSSVHAYAVSHGLTNLSMDEMYDEYQRGHMQRGDGVAHTQGRVRNTVFNSFRTVGSHLPTYYELLGPIGTLFLRNQESPMALLLGSYGPYSSDDFGRMMRGINSKADVHVMDINRIYTTQAERSPQRGVNHHIVTGDAREIQYPENTFNIICTNFLFGFVDPIGVEAPTYTDRINEIKKIFKSVFLALKPGGSFLIVENLKDISGGLVSSHITKNKLLQIAKEVGFKFERQLPTTLFTPLSREQGVLRPGESGFTDYRDVLILKEDQDLGLRLTKPRS